MPTLGIRSVWFPQKFYLHRRLHRCQCSICTHLTLTSVPSKLIPRILFSNVLFVFSIYACKEWLLTYDVGIFWVLMRVLACGGFGVLVWEGFTRQSSKRKTYEVSHFLFWVQAKHVCWYFVSGRYWVQRLYCSSCDMHACSRHYINFPRHGKKVIYLYFIATLCLYLTFRVILFAHFPIYWIGSLLSLSIASIFHTCSSYHEKLKAFCCIRPEKPWR